jgi:hypothetical protein
MEVRECVMVSEKWLISSRPGNVDTDGEGEVVHERGGDVVPEGEVEVYSI